MNVLSKNELQQLIEVQKTLTYSNEMLLNATQVYLAEMEELAKTKVEIQPLVDVSKLILEDGENICQVIQSLKEELIEKSGGVFSEDLGVDENELELKGQPLHPDDDEIAKIVLLEDAQANSKGKVLEQQLLELKEKQLSRISDLWTQSPINALIFSQPSFRDSILNVLKEESPFELYPEGFDTQSQQSWAEYHFSDKPLIVIINILNQFQNQIRKSEIRLIKFLWQEIFSANKKYKLYDAFALSEQPIVRIGDSYKTQIGLVEYAGVTKFQVFLDGEELSVHNGKASHKTIPQRTGSYTPNLRVTTHSVFTGEAEHFSKSLSFEVIPK